MAVKKNAPLQDLGMDPAVQAYLGNGQQVRLNEQREREKSLSKSQRRKRKRDKARIKATYDLPAGIKEQVENIAAEYRIPKSQLVAFLLDRALREYAQGKIDLQPHLRPSRVPRFEMFLKLPEESKADEWMRWQGHF